MTNEVAIDRDRALRRIRLLVTRVEQDCSLHHPELCRLRMMLDKRDRPLTHEDVMWLVDILHCSTADCTGTERCEMLRTDLENELKEFDS